MTEEILQNETEIRRFLLGELTEDERSAFEMRFVADENLFEQTQVVEDELIESYIRGTLSPADKTNFEKHFLATETRRQKVEFTRRMIGKFNNQNESFAVKKTETVETNPSVLSSLIGFFKTPKLAFGAAFALLILIFGGLFLLRNPKQNEIAVMTTPTPIIQETPNIEPNQNQNLKPTNQIVSGNLNTNATVNIQPNKNSVNLNANRKQANENQNSTPTVTNTSGVVPILALFAGSVRGEGKMPELTLSNATPKVYLLLNLESKDYKIYRAEIVDADGRPIFSNNKIQSGNSKLTLAVPAEKLRRGDYIVKLSGVNPSGETESVADYSFRVKRK